MTTPRFNRLPDYEGFGGSAWALNLTPRTPGHYAALYSSLIFAPNAHPFWSWHLLTVIHLRDIVGVAPAKKNYPGAEFELSVWAVDPSEKDMNPDRDEGWSLLRPYDVLIQFDGVDNVKARRIGELATKACTQGILVPDSDFRSLWDGVIGETLAHLKEGRH